MKQIAITLLLCILLHHVVEAKGEKTITVSNVEEFLNAIGKDRTIIMKTGDYVLIEKSDMKGEYYEFTDAYDGKELLIHDVDNLNIIGSDDLTTHLITSPNYGHVIRFKNVAKFYISQQLFISLQNENKSRDKSIV